MVRLNPNFKKFENQPYLFKEMSDRRAAFIADHPDREVALIRMGIGDITEPLPKVIT